MPVTVFAILTVVSAVLGARGPRPGASAGDTLAYTQAHPTLIGWSSALLVGSAIPLGVAAATINWRLGRLGARVPGPLMGLTGAILAGSALAASGAFVWTSGQVADLDDAAVSRALTTLAFSAGGPVFVTGFGLMIAGFTVPALILRLTPRPFAWFGLAVAVLSLLGWLALVSDAFYPLLPIGRFGGLIVLVGIAATLPGTRGRGRRPGPARDATGIDPPLRSAKEPSDSQSPGR